MENKEVKNNMKNNRNRDPKNPHCCKCCRYGVDEMSHTGEVRDGILNVYVGEGRG